MVRDRNSMVVRIVTGCSSLDEFTTVFRHLCTVETLFLPTATPLARDTELKFSIALKDGSTGREGKVVLRGNGKISESYTEPGGLYERAGMMLELGKLDAMGRILLRELNAGSPEVAKKGDRDDSFDVSTVVETADLEDLKTILSVKEVEGEAVHSSTPPSVPRLDELVACSVRPESATESEQGETTDVADEVSGESREITLLPGQPEDTDVGPEEEETLVPALEANPETPNTPLAGYASLEPANKQAAGKDVGAPETAPSTPPPSTPRSQRRSIASLPMISSVATVRAAASHVLKSPAMVSRTHAAIFAALCLIAGIGFGLLLGKGKEQRVSGSAPTMEPKSALVVSDANSQPPAPPIVPSPDASPLPPESVDCEILLDVGPADARVLLGEVLVEAGTMSVSVPCGTIRVGVEHDEYENVQVDVQVSPGKVASFSHRMQRESITLRVESTPSNAWIKIDGKAAGTTPLEYAVPAFEKVEVLAGKSGFKAVTQTFVPKTDMSVDLRLRRRQGKRRRRGK